MRNTLIDYNEICFENLTLQMEMEGLSDDVLLEECNHILNGYNKNKIMDEIFVKYFKTGKITKDERAKAESLYLLAYGEFVWEI
jgi:hypothetical protein